MTNLIRRKSLLLPPSIVSLREEVSVVYIFVLLCFLTIVIANCKNEYCGQHSENYVFSFAH